MKSYRENPAGEENQRATKQNEREIFALKMQAKRDEAEAETHSPEMVVRADAQSQPQ